MDTARDEAAKAARLGFLMHAAHAALWSLCSSSERRARTAYARSMVFWADDKVSQFCRVQPAPFLNLPMQPLPLVDEVPRCRVVYEVARKCPPFGATSTTTTARKDQPRGKAEVELAARHARYGGACEDPVTAHVSNPIHALSSHTTTTLTPPSTFFFFFAAMCGRLQAETCSWRWRRCPPPKQPWPTRLS